MILYESASVVHGRPQKLNGLWDLGLQCVFFCFFCFFVFLFFCFFVFLFFCLFFFVIVNGSHPGRYYANFLLHFRPKDGWNLKTL